MGVRPHEDRLRAGPYYVARNGDRQSGDVRHVALARSWLLLEPVF